MVSRVAVGVGAVAALGAVGAAAVGGDDDVVLVDVGAALSMDVGADIVESQREVGRPTQEREAGYGKAHAASPRPHT